VSWWAKNSAKRYKGLRPLKVSRIMPSTTVPGSTAISVGTNCWIVSTQPILSAEAFTMGRCWT
jgi:hypothetical protein